MKKIWVTYNPQISNSIIIMYTRKKHNLNCDTIQYMKINIKLCFENTKHKIDTRYLIIKI